MRTLILIAAVALPASSTASPPKPTVPARVAGAQTAEKCPIDTRLRPALTTDGVRAQRLGELPPANHILAVLDRDEAGCVEPRVARYGVLPRR